MKFSERIGKTPVRSTMQIASIDKPLENRLWNTILKDFFYQYVRNQQEVSDIIIPMWDILFKERTDELPQETYSTKICINSSLKIIKEWFFSCEWYEKYDLIEFIVQFDSFRFFTRECNEVLKKEMAGYRIIEGNVVQITAEEEIAEIEEAISDSSIWKPVQEHLRTALNILADRENPQHRNSIKESISAVESMCKIITQKPKATLGDALKELEKSYNLHPSYKQAFEKLYGYTSDSGGIRHCLLDDSVDVTMEDAKFMLVSCSAFINYLKAKIS